MVKTMAHSYSEAKISSIEMQENSGPALSPVENRSSAIDSSGDSLDSDMLSISSEDSDFAQRFDPESALAPIVDQVSHRIYAEFKESRDLTSRPDSARTGIRGREGNSDNSEGSGNSSNHSECRATCQLNGTETRRNGKRGRPNDEEEGEDRDEGGFRRPPRPTKRAARSPNRPRARILACPFWKLDSHAHRNCFRMKCSRIADVKYHLSRKHRQPASEYCQRCWIAFQNDAHKRAHLSDDSGQRCRYDPAARPVGIDNTMAAALHKKSNPKQSTEDQWFAIWEIVFPGQPRPSSPYIDDGLTEDATQLQELIVNRWPSILASILDGAEVSDASVEAHGLEREHLIRATLARLSEDFSAEQARLRAARLDSSHQSPGGQTSSSSVRADSAIGMSSYESSRQLSTAPSDEGASRSIPGPATSPIGSHLQARSQGGEIPNRHERRILPPGQNTNNDEQQTLMPPPATTSRPDLPDLVNPQTTDLYEASPSSRTDFTVNDQFPPPIQDTAPLGFEGGEFGISTSIQSMEDLIDFDWSAFAS